MSRMKSIFAVLVLAVIAGVVPQAYATTPTVNLELLLAGSSGAWQMIGVSAWNGGNSVATGGGLTCHWTSGSNKVNLTDTRTTVANNDPGTMWVVWDNNASSSTCLGDGTNTTTNVWAYVKVDTIVGDRCYFAVPKCYASGTSGNIAAAGAGKISSTIWGSDALIPSYIQPIFTGTTAINAAASDIRPEDALFETCRVNSALGASATSGSVGDNLDGLGYNSNNAAGVCPVYNITTAQAKGLGSPILSAVSIKEGGSSQSQANVLAFNISGHDPITNSTVPAYTVTALGAVPVVFVISRAGVLANVTNASENTLQQVFSGANCDGGAFTGGAAGGINVFLREPLSGTMSTAEFTVFRRPTVYPNAVLGLSQETGVNPAASGGNPLDPTVHSNCTSSDGKGGRWGVVGSGEAVAGVQDSQSAFGGIDGISYAFFSYGNVSGILGNNYGYLQLNGVDPIFQSYNAGKTIDPGQPSHAGNLPGVTDLPSSCAGAFPCPESAIWGNGFSFPNVRNGTYRSWSIIRLIATGTASTNAKALVTIAQKGAMNIVPDFVPAAAIVGTTELGLKLVRSHYQQRDGAGVNLGGAPVNTGTDKGGDAGGMIIPTTIGVSTSKQINLIQNSDPNDGLGPAVRQ